MKEIITGGLIAFLIALVCYVGYLYINEHENDEDEDENDYFNYF